MTEAMHTSMLRKPLKLCNWIFAFAFPSSGQQFIHSKARGEHCLNFKGFDEYRKAILFPLDRFIVPLERCGLHIVRYPTAKRYARLLRGEYSVVLYTHSSNGRLEFREGMVPFSDVADAVTPKYRGIAEICACRGGGMQELLKKRAPHCVTKVMDDELSDRTWLFYYSYFFSAFIPGPTSYWEATVNASLLFQNRKLESRSIETYPDEKGGA